MKNVLLATGSEKIDSALTEGLQNHGEINVLPNPVYFREGLSDSILRLEPDVVIISDFLDGASLSQQDLIRIMRTRHASVRIVYLLKDKTRTELQRFLIALSVFDVLTIHPRLDLKELVYMITVGKEWKDIAHLVSDLDPADQFKIDEEMFYSNEGDNSNQKYEMLGVNKKQSGNSSFVEIASFWSPRAQSGSTMLATNSTLLFGQNDKVLLVDLNLNNPNVHLHYSMNVGNNHNLAALMEDLERGKVNNLSDIRKYIVFHKTLTSIHILPGFILKNALPDEHIISKTIDIILMFAKKVGYSAIIFDVEPGLDHPISLKALKSSTKIITPILETPGSIISLQKFFDPELGPFFHNMLDINKIHPILNESTDSIISEKVSQLASSILNRRIYAKIPRSNEISNNIANGMPILRERPDQKMLREFIKTANCIEDVFVVPALNTKRKSLFKK